MATPVLMSLTSALLGSGTSEVLSACGKLLAERVNAAHDNYQQAAAQAGDAVENERHDAISKINELRNRAALSVADLDLQQKIWCLLMEQTAEAYEATTVRGISLVKDNTGQIEDEASITCQRSTSMDTLNLFELGDVIVDTKKPNSGGDFGTGKSHNV